MRYLLIAAAALYGLGKAVQAVRAAWRWWSAPSRMVELALEYEMRQKRSEGMAHGYELEG